jgi:hypothetical protein
MLTRSEPERKRGAEVLEEPGVVSAAAPAHVAHGAGVSRRTLLAASAAALPLLLTACKGVQALGTPPPPAPDIVALRTAISAEEVMVARYAAVLKPYRSGGTTSTQSPDLVIVTAVKAVYTEHVAHLAQLRSRLVESPGSAPSPSPSPSPSASPSQTAPVTGPIASELTMLEQAEQAASDRLIGQLGGLPPTLAQLFASIAASEATHVPYLQSVRPSR